MSANFAILRRESSGGYSTRGPVAHAMTLKEARAEVAHLKRDYPHQDFVIMGEVGEATLSERITVRIDAPDLGDAKPKVRKQRKAPPVAPPAPEVQPAQLAANVVPLRKEEAC